MFLAYKLAPEARSLLLGLFPPRDGMEVICDHVTRCLDRSRDREAIHTLGQQVRIQVVGRFSDEGNDVLVVEVDGEMLRPDGHIYHITLAVDRAQGGVPKRSNELLEARVMLGGIEALRNIEQPVVVDGVLELVEGWKTPKKARPPRMEELPTEVVELEGGLIREDTVGTERIRSLYRAPDRSVLAVRVVERSTGKTFVDKGLYGGAANADEAIAFWHRDNGLACPAL